MCCSALFSAPQAENQYCEEHQDDTACYFHNADGSQEVLFSYRVVMKTVEEHPVNDRRTADFVGGCFDQCQLQIPGVLLDALQVTDNPAVGCQDDRTSAEEFPEGDLPAFRIAEQKIQRNLVSQFLIHPDLSEDLFFAGSGVRCRGQEKLPGKKECKSIY